MHEAHRQKHEIGGDLEVAAGNRFHRHFPQRAHVGSGLPHFSFGHGTGARHLRAADAFLKNFDERRVVRSTGQLGASQHRSAAALALGSVAQRAVIFEQLLAIGEVGAGGREFNFRFGNRGQDRDTEQQG